MSWTLRLRKHAAAVAACMLFGTLGAPESLVVHSHGGGDLPHVHVDAVPAREIHDHPTHATQSDGDALAAAGSEGASHWHRTLVATAREHCPPPLFAPSSAAPCFAPSDQAAPLLRSTLRLQPRAPPLPALVSKI